MNRRQAATLPVLLFALVSCGSSSDTSTGSSSDVPTTTSTSGSASTSGSPSTSVPAPSGSASTTTDTTPAIVDAVKAFLGTLTSAQQDAASFAFSDTAQRQRWSNFPQGLFQRDGVMWGDLSDASHAAWLTVMQTTLSKEGYQRVLAEWNADDQLAASGGGGNLQYGTQYYWIAIIGTPSATDAWQWQWGGHHVTINATIKGSDVSLNPSFIGAQPATYDAQGNQVRPLGDILDEATALVTSLDSAEQGKAILGSTSIDLVLGPGEDGKTVANEGLPGSAMTSSQRAALLKLIDHYGNLVDAEDAASRLAQLKADLGDTYFAWYGPTDETQSVYFRVTGPYVVIEYSDQSLGGDPADHVHGIYRDPTNDYGAAFGAGLG